MNGHAGSRSGHDIEHWLPGLRGGPMRLQELARKHPFVAPPRQREWPVWLCLAVVTAGLLTAVIAWR